MLWGVDGGFSGAVQGRGVHVIHILQQKRRRSACSGMYGGAGSVAGTDTVVIELRDRTVCSVEQDGGGTILIELLL